MKNKRILFLRGKTQDHEATQRKVNTSVLGKKKW